MKRILMISMICLFLFGCGQAARESGYYQHDTMYRDWSHLWFSWTGYKNVTSKDVKKSSDELWWGIPEEARQQRATPSPSPAPSR